MHAGFTISPDALDEELAVKEVSNRFLRGFGSVPAGHDERTSHQHKAALSLKLDVSEAAQKALDLKEEVRLRQPGALSTQRYLSEVNTLLKCISDENAPVRTGPVLWHILQNLLGANSQLHKVSEIRLVDPLQGGNLMVLMKATVFRIHILFTVVAVAMLPDQDPCELMDNVHRSLFPARLQETRPSQSAQQASTTLTALEAAMAAACQGCNATEVQKRINTLITSMLALDDAGMSTVEGANARTVSEVTHHMLNCPVCQSLVRLGTEFHRTVSEAQACISLIRAEVQSIILAMAAARSIRPDSLSTAGEIVLEELCQARTSSPDPGLWATTRAGANAVAGRLLERLATARSRLPACPITGLPYATTPHSNGGVDSHAVKLHACGCCMSKCAAAATLAAGTCAACRQPLPRGSAYQLSTAMLRVAQAHRSRILPPEATPDRLAVSTTPFPVPLSVRAHGAFRQGTLHGKPAAVLQLHLGDMLPAHRACISHALVATHLAAVLSPVHCGILAVMWEAEQVSVAYDPKPFQGRVATATMPAEPLTVADVIAAGNVAQPARQALEVVIDAAEAHAAAKAAAWSDSRAPAFGALTPDRILVCSDHRVQISDFRLLERSCVPPAVAEALRERAPLDELPAAQSPQVERYMAPEAVGAGEGAPEDSDAMTVFSLGALLHFMVAGRHPPTSTELESYSRVAPWGGSTRALTQSITRVNLAANAPPETDEMRARMMDMRASDRPLLAEATVAIMRELYVQMAQAAAGGGHAGKAPGCVVPAWDRTQPPASAPCTVFRIPERATPLTFLPRTGATVASMPSETSGPMPERSRPLRNTYVDPARGAPAPGVTTGLASDTARSPLQHNASQGHTSGSQASAMSVCVDGRSAAARGGTTTSSWGAAEPLPSCEPSLAGSGPMDRAAIGVDRGTPASAETAGERDACAGASPFDTAHEADRGGEARARGQPSAAERASSGAIPADAASQASNASNERRPSGGLPAADHMSSPRRSRMQRISSWFSRGGQTTVAALVQLLNGDWNGEDCDLKGRQFKLSPSRGGGGSRNLMPAAQDATAAAAPQLGWDVTIHEQEINFQTPSFDPRSIFKLVPRDDSARLAATCFIIANGTVVREGYLDLGLSGRLVFGPDCENITLRNMTIRDGTLICYGKSCVVRMESCALSGCSVIAVGGASVTIASNCDFGAATRIAVFAHGAGTSVSIESSGLRGCRQAVCVAAGARVELMRCIVSGVTVIGCEVRGSGSTLELRDCTVADADWSSHSDWWIQGVWVHSGARAIVTRCTLMRMVAGVLADGEGTELHLHEASCVSNLACGAYVGCGATATFRECDFFSVSDSPSQQLGLDVCNSGSSATMIHCRLRYMSFGARVSDGATLKCVNCQTEQNGVAGWCAEQKGDADLESCVSVGERAYLLTSGASCRTVLCRPDVMG